MLGFTFVQRGEFARMLPFHVYVSLDFAEAKKDKRGNEIEQFDPYDTDLFIYFLQYKDEPVQSQEEFERNLISRGFTRELIASSLVTLTKHKLIILEGGSYKINPSVYVKSAESKEAPLDLKEMPAEHKATKKHKYHGAPITKPHATNLRELISCFDKLVLAESDGYKNFFSRLNDLKEVRDLILTGKAEAIESRKIGRNMQIASDEMIKITNGLLCSIAKIQSNLGPSTHLEKIERMLKRIENKWKTKINISFSRPIDEMQYRPLKRKEFYNMLDQFYTAIDNMREMVAICGRGGANPAAFFTTKLAAASVPEKDAKELVVTLGRS